MTKPLIGLFHATVIALALCAAQPARGEHLPVNGQSCVSCHDPSDQYAPRCERCHAEKQGKRRKVLGQGGDFARASRHMSGPPKPKDCLVCHDRNGHREGVVKLLDPDQGAKRVFKFDPANPRALEGFCLGCHDQDGARASGGERPFSGGKVPPDIEQGGRWAASAHARGGSGQSGSSCFSADGVGGCHGNAHGSNLRKLLQPSDGSPGPDNAEEEEGFCYRCHRDGQVQNEALSNGWFGGVYQVFSSSVEHAFGLASRHPVNDSAPGHWFKIGNCGREELECTSCHRVHQDTGRYWDAGRGRTPVSLYPSGDLWGDDLEEKLSHHPAGLIYQSPSLGGAGADLSDNPLPIDPLGMSLLEESALPDYNALCLACHRRAVGGLNGLDWAVEKHGLAAAEPMGPQGEALAGPYLGAHRGQYLLQCLDCHEAHGSPNARLVRPSANGAPVPGPLTDPSIPPGKGLCDRCHAVAGQAEWHHREDVYAKLGGDGSCVRCHNIHSPTPIPSCLTAGCHGHGRFF